MRQWRYEQTLPLAFCTEFELGRLWERRYELLEEKDTQIADLEARLAELE